MANNAWLNLFSNYEVQNLPHLFSDHCPILIKTEINSAHDGRNRFKFESWWLMEPNCADVIRQLWDEKSGDAFAKLENLRAGLQKWRRSIKYTKDRKMKNLRD